MVLKLKPREEQDAPTREGTREETRLVLSIMELEPRLAPSGTPLPPARQVGWGC
jgi:hypothetical protein